MIKHIINEYEISNILEYIDDKYHESIYLYLNINKYGLRNSKIKVWIQYNDNDIESVILKYYTGLHIYSRKKIFNIRELCQLIYSENPTIICAERSIIVKLGNLLPDYKIKFGFIAQYQRQNSFDFELKSNIVRALPQHYDDMIKMLLQDEIGKTYTYSDLKDQITNRIADNYSRSYCIYNGDKLVAQISTGAEESGVATLSYVMTDSHYRNKGYASELVKHLSEELSKEEFKVYLIYYDEIASQLYKKMGFEDIGLLGKLYK
ncbi:GNAT family N-acetyltransferase [Enterococcus columbae]|uniref:N-acetyltransferase domain-containing protein n=1 Tax=Enterococcus columbae DSM 7374 = ATCC 51263 TaxID=1121865 RepID=S1NUT5_9ENTE|nr:GNAT family N-acetyltransferase [Enterococcus columbae]EOT39961.1 hypothetical protein OMW_01750 [Enterococcus columbae DSM 7374 = ATCC 51263]EOW83946.1 hypothetical protein I568_01393 [Enterococcus columbae DSM 7374 = ATCC 51263]OJG25835.1 hypothetical protein RR47_GL001341 [Enterococcus columbae DSM 7374 = ATCC 51263]